jgi:hypothetical protein
LLKLPQMKTWKTCWLQPGHVDSRVFGCACLRPSGRRLGLYRWSDHVRTVGVFFLLSPVSSLWNP